MGSGNQFGETLSTRGSAKRQVEEAVHMKPKVIILNFF